MQKTWANKSFIWLSLIMLIAALLRIPFLDRFPPGLYSDEADQAYNAYSILKTGKDEHGVMLPISFRSFGDWKPPLQTYAMVPTIALLGLNAYGARLPSALLGTLTVFLTYILVKKLLFHFPLGKRVNINVETVALIAAGLIALSPWHIAQSRAAMLICIELFFLMLAVVTFLSGLRKPKWWYLSSISWALAIYSYYGMRLIAPLFLFFLAIQFRKQLLDQKQMVVKAGILALIVLSPLCLAFFQNPDVVFGRAKTVSVFYDQGVALTVWDHIAQDGSSMPHFLAQFFHNKPYYFLVDILRRFFQHFDLRFLFSVGDTQLPFQIPNQGVLYLIDGILIIAGIRWLLRRGKPALTFLLFWLVASIFPAALTFVTPAANRTFTAVIPYLIFAAFGIGAISQLPLRKRQLALIGISTVYLVSVGAFLWNYFLVLPKEHADWWHGGYQELYTYLTPLETSTDKIAISAKASMPYIFLLVYKQIDPTLAQTELHHNYVADQFGFEHVDSFGKYQFPRVFTWEKQGERLPSGSILVLTPGETVGQNAQEIHTIIYPNGQIAFKIYKISANE